MRRHRAVPGRSCVDRLRDAAGVSQSEIQPRWQAWRRAAGAPIIGAMKRLGLRLPIVAAAAMLGLLGIVGAFAHAWPQAIFGGLGLAIGVVAVIRTRKATPDA